MFKARIYILQILGILLLLCGYFLSDQPDSKSVMHFKSDPAHPSVFTKAIKYTGNEDCVQTSVNTDHSARHKSKVPKHISFEILLPAHKSGYVFNPQNRVEHASALPEQYCYLFYEEINPPPPKAC